jgi:myosin-5
MNPAMLEASDDLTNLSHLNEPAGTSPCSAIGARRILTAGSAPGHQAALPAEGEIYTYSGIVLIATNPFARVDSLYVPGMVQVYAGKQRSYGAPHLFAIAEEAFA